MQGSGSGSPVTFVDLSDFRLVGGVGVVQLGRHRPAGTDRSALSVANLKLSPTRFHRGAHVAKIAK